MKKIALITGIAGQDGSYLAELLLSKNYEVHGLEIKSDDKKDFWRIRHILDKLIVHAGDVSDYETAKKLMAEVKPDEIYHLAAKHDLPNSLENYLAVKAANLDSVYFFLSAVKEFSPKSKFFFASSSRVFGDSQISPQNEETPVKPDTLYGIFKAAASAFVKIYREKEGIFACSGILYNHESPRRDPEFLSRKIAMAAARIKSAAADSLSVGDLEAHRDWGYAPDYVEGMWLMLQQDKSDDYILATNENHTVREFIEEAAKLLDFDLIWEGEGLDEKGIDRKTGKTIVEIDPRYLRPAEVDVLIGDYSKAKQKLGWEPKVRFKDLVKIMVEAELNGNKVK